MLELAGVNSFYGQSHVLHDIDLRVADGAGVAIVGLNGMGELTLLKSVLGVGPTVRGAVHLDGQDLTHSAPHRRARLGLALVPEDRRIYPHLTVAENLALAGYAKAAGQDCYSVDEVLKAFPLLQKLAQRRGFQLSGGEQQLVAVARATLSRPRCLLLDEPHEGLAPLIVNTMAEEMNRIRQRKGWRWCWPTEYRIRPHLHQEVVVLSVGRIAFSGTWAEFDANPAIRETYFSL